MTTMISDFLLTELWSDTFIYRLVQHDCIYHKQTFSYRNYIQVAIDKVQNPTFSWQTDGLLNKSGSDFWGCHKRSCWQSVFLLTAMLSSTITRKCPSHQVVSEKDLLCHLLVFGSCIQPGFDSHLMTENDLKPEKWTQARMLTLWNHLKITELLTQNYLI